MVQIMSAMGNSCIWMAEIKTRFSETTGQNDLLHRTNDVCLIK
jgi:hypothetical protein